MSKDSSSETASPTTRSKSSEQAQPYDPETLVGRVIADRYEVKRCIGKGGMGVVYLASQNALDRNVVIKVLPSSFIDDEEARLRFEREARGMSRLQHPNIVAIHDFGHEDEHTYICMEHVAGETLSRRLKRDGAMSLQVFAHIAAQILKGIEEAHQRGMIHRDIKPSNIMLTERHGQQDYVKILDFGLAKLVKGSHDVTSEQSLVGSTAFLSPEQIMGNDIDQRVDVYALGVLFFYMLAGEKPFQADEDITVLYQHVHEDPPPLLDFLDEAHRVPEELVELIERMLAKDPDERPDSASSVLEEFKQIILRTSMEFAWADGDSSGVLGDDPSAQLERARFHTPTGGSAAPVSGSQPVPNLGEPGSGSQQTFVTGEQMLQIQRDTTRRTLLIVVVALLIAGAGLFAFLTLRDDRASAEDITSEIARAERLIEQQKLGQAENTLELLESDIQHHPELKGPYAASMDRLEIARLLSDAEFFEEQGRIDEAIDAYKKALSRDGSLDEAEAALDALREERERKAQAEAAEDDPSDASEATNEAVEAAGDRLGPAVEEAKAAPVAEKPKKKRKAKKKRAQKKKAPPEPEEPADGGATLLPVENDGDEAEEESSDDVELLPID